MTLKQYLKKVAFRNVEDLEEYLRHFKVTAQQLEDLNNGNLDAITFRQAVALSESLFLNVDELLKIATEKLPTRTRKLAKLRKTKGVTVEQAAEVIGNLAGSYQAKEKGVINFYALDFIRLGNELGVHHKELIPEKAEVW